MDSQNKTILIVEDEGTLRLALSKKCRLERYRVIEAKDGEEGLLMAKEQKPDIILLDLVMPKMDGVTMLKLMKKDPAVAGIPVIVLTNLSDNQMVSEALQNGVYDFLIKSNYTLNDVMEKVYKKLNP